MEQPHVHHKNLRTFSCRIEFVSGYIIQVIPSITNDISGKNKSLGLIFLNVVILIIIEALIKMGNKLYLSHTDLVMVYKNMAMYKISAF